jgi:hypothetical protein
MCQIARGAGLAAGPQSITVFAINANGGAASQELSLVAQ